MYGLSFLQPTVYEAEGTLLLNDPRSSGGIASDIGLVLDPSRYVRNQAQVLESPQVAERAATLLDDGTSTMDVQESVSATPSSNLDTVTITARAPTAQRSVNLVIAVEAAYEQIVSEQIQSAVDASIRTLEVSSAETQARIAELDALLQENPTDASLEAQRTAAISRLVAIDNRMEQLATNASLYGSGVQLFVAPDVPTSPVQPLPIRNGVAAFLAGAMAMAAWAWWHADRHQVADDRNAPAEVLDAPLLASIPEFKYVGVKGPAPSATDPTSAAAEAYQFAFSALRFALEDINGTTVLVTSASPGDGKSATALNIAIAATLDSTKALLIDADERARGLTRLAGIAPERGAPDVPTPGPANRISTVWEVGNGTAIPFQPARSNGGVNAPSYYRSARFRDVLAAARESQDLVIVDSPPVMAAAETADVASLTDAIVVVVAEGTPLGHLRDVKARLDMSGTPIIGYIFNRATPRSGGASYGYGYGYGVADDD